MKYTTPNTTRRPNRTLLACALASCMLVAAPQLLAQSTGATIRGQVSDDSAPAGGAAVTATNVDTGLARSAQTSPSGTYSLPGLPPGTYQLDVTTNGQTNSQRITVKVGQTATVNLGVGGVAESAPAGEATNLDTVTVKAPIAVETKTSEVATYVSQKQIEALPQGSRNFLAFADTVPGMIFETRGDGRSTQLRSGAQSSNGINVYIDGVGQKNYVTKGGTSGQDVSAGNPFPQLAIGEYKVITSNYKAEYDQISSAAITAVTKSGTNDFDGNFFWSRNGTPDWREATPAEERSGTKSPSGDDEYGASFGGPIIKDNLFFFATYENKQFTLPANISLGGGVPSGTPVPPDFIPLLGPTSQPFDEDLYFGKLTWQLGDANLIELTGKKRTESQLADIGGQNTRTYGKTNNNDDTRYDLRWQWSSENWLNDAHLTHEDTQFNPRAITFGPGINVVNNTGGTLLNVGGGQDFQDKGQKGYGFQDDLTFYGMEGHTIKAGVKFKSVEINAFEQQPYNPQYGVYLLPNQAAGNNSLASFIPFSARFGAPIGDLDRNVTSKNKQYGFYIQDDWEVNDHLLVNLGLRYDYERTPGYLDYVTPPALVTALQNWSNINQGNAGYDINDFISTGKNRDAFKSAWQPRLGLSYDLFADQRHVIFGGAGRAYDRNLFDYIALEQSRSTFPQYTVNFFDAPMPAGNAPCTPGPTCVAWNPSYYDRNNLYALVAANPNLGSEVDLIQNDIKVPYSDQFSLGMRNLVDVFGSQWTTSASVVRINSHDGIFFALGNRYADGTFFAPGRSFGGAPFGEQIPGYGSLIIARNGVETRLNQLLLSAEKPYSTSSPWAVTLAYTYSDSKENRSNAANTDEHYVFDYPNLDGHGYVRSIGISKHRFVGTGIVDLGWGVTFSTKLTLASPVAKDVLNCLAPVDPGVDGCGNAKFEAGYFSDADFRQLDLALQKEIDTGTGFSMRIRGDVFNVTNERNWTGFNTFRGIGGVQDPGFGNHNDDIAYPTRSFKLTFGLNW